MDTKLFIKALTNLAPTGWSSLGTWETVIWHNDAPDVKPTKDEVEAEAARLLKMDAIAALEAQITPRRLRDAVLGVEGGAAWITAKETEIQVLRDELAGK